MTLLERTVVLLDRRIAQAKGSRTDEIKMLREIADSSGGAVQFEWLRKFQRGVIDNPGVITIQALHDCLTKKSAAAA